MSHESRASSLDRFLPTPRLREVDSVDVGVDTDRAYAEIASLDLGELALARALFSLRTVPDRLAGKESEAPDLRLSTMLAAEHGFRPLAIEPGRGIAVGAIGRVWEPAIPFVDVAPDAFAAYAEPGQVKVAWSVGVEAITTRTSRITVEVRVDATDDASWTRFRRYFALIGTFSRLIRRMLLSRIATRLGSLESAESAMALPGDELITEPLGSRTDAITIAAPPERVWPWLVQMGGDRAGWYSIDPLDHGAPSAREIDPRLQHLAEGETIAATDRAPGGFVVARIDPERALVLWGATDLANDRQLSLGDPMPSAYWRVSWAFVLQPAANGATRLVVRVRGDWAPPRMVWRARVALLVHGLMERAQLEHLKQRAEGTLPRDTSSDVLEGASGAARILGALATPHLRAERSHWGLDAELAARTYPGDERVHEPRWSWTHAIEVDAEPARVWPWVAQIGADRAGFYSYQFLENLAGCSLENADRIHDEWVRSVTSAPPMTLHPAMPPLPVVAIDPGRFFLAHAPRAAGDPLEANVSWLFLVEPLPGGRSRVVSRFRSSYGDALTTRLAMGPALMEPIGFAMDRRMLLGVKERAERA